MQMKSAVKKYFDGRWNKEYNKKLSQKKVDYDTWVRRRESRTAKTGETDRDFVIFHSENGQVSGLAEQYLQEYFGAHPECMLLYGDEDVLGTDGVRRTPWYKPCWSPHLYRDCFYMGSLVAVRSHLLTGRRCEQPRIYKNASEMQAFLQPLLQELSAFERGCRAIAGVPQILFHVPEEGAWKAFLPAGIVSAVCVAGSLKVSVIIPSKDHPDILEKCLETVRPKVEQGRAEIIVVDNGSTPENRKRLEKLLAGERMRYLYEPMEFNFSRMCNLGASNAQGELLLFLNDDMEMCGDDWMEQMMAEALQPETGAVGLKLYYPDSVKIQHDGIVNLPVGPVHKLQFFEDNRRYYYGWNCYNRDCLAVTGACLMIEKGKFQEAGGFPEELKVAYNDVDLGFRLWEAGYHNVVLNHHHAYHHESLSRGDDETWEKQKRLSGERELLYKRHPALRGVDPYFPAQLNIEGLDSRIVPGYFTAYNTLQVPSWGKLRRRLYGFREDPCLMVRVESTGPERIQGYGVVLGDDNACYERFLVLLQVQGSEPQNGTAYEEKNFWCMRLAGQYRQDLEQNLPDQKNVGLCGFSVSRKGEQLAPGVYRVGLIAARRWGALKLLGWSGKEMIID